MILIILAIYLIGSILAWLAAATLNDYFKWHIPSWVILLSWAILATEVIFIIIELIDNYLPTFPTFKKK